MKISPYTLWQMRGDPSGTVHRLVGLFRQGELVLESISLDLNDEIVTWSLPVGEASHEESWLGPAGDFVNLFVPFQ